MDNLKTTGGGIRHMFIFLPFGKTFNETTYFNIFSLGLIKNQKKQKKNLSFVSLRKKQNFQTYMLKFFWFLGKKRKNSTKKK